MDRRKQNQIRRNRETAKSMPVSWWFGVIAIISLAFWATSSAVFKHAPEPKAENSATVMTERETAPAKSVQAAVTNVEQQSDTEKAAAHLNRGTELLDQGKVDEAVAHYQ